MKPLRIYYEEDIFEYPLGKMLKEKYEDVPWLPIESHNKILELTSRPNTDFVEMKRYLVIGTRKTHKYVDNHKTSDYLVPFTSSGCSAMCLYCYLVCSYNKCSYLRIFVNREKIMDKLIKTSLKAEKELTFEIGSNSDLVVENKVTGNLPWVIESFGEKGRGKITFPTKFSTVEPLLGLKHEGKCWVRVSVNPQEIVSKIEIGTSRLKNRIQAINALFEAGYPVGLLIAPVVLIENWKEVYVKMLDQLAETLHPKLKKDLPIEIIFMTYSYVHRAINNQAFPNAIELYEKELMTGRGMGRYCYKQSVRQEGEVFLRSEIEKRFDGATILYVV